jgi:hypothetical protein
MRRRRSSEINPAKGDDSDKPKVNGSDDDAVINVKTMCSITEASVYDGDRFNMETGMQALSVTPLVQNVSDADQISETNGMNRYIRCRKIIIYVYFLHGACILGILLLGIVQNGGYRKYVPVDPKGLANLVRNEFKEEFTEEFPEPSCVKAYVDVHTSSVKDDLAFVCCARHGPASLNLADGSQKYQSNLCNPRVLGISMQQLPFSKRLTRFPEAWILPMLPIFIRLVYQLVCSLWLLLNRCSKSPSPVKSPSTYSLQSPSSLILENVVVESPSSEPTIEAQTPSHARIRVTIQRLLFYFLILNFRGWGLYIGANAIEDYLIVPWFTGNKVVSPLRTDSVSDVEHNIQSSNHDCWYKEVLKAHHRSAMENDFYSGCYGRPFDFSDHIVLFLAHYLPIFVMENFYCWLFPFWDSSQSQAKDQTPLRRVFARNSVILHAGLFCYMHLIVLHATHQTTAYFHSSAEIIVGYVISWIIQIPLLYLLCFERCVFMRRFVGLPVNMISGTTQNQKGE